jgi:hypothetical protein
MRNFYINLPNNLVKREDPFLPDRIREELSGLENALLDFISLYEQNEWHIYLDGNTFKCWFNDIPFIWNELPSYLADISHNNGEFHYIDIVNQGSEKVIIAENLPDETLAVSILTSQDHSEFYNVPISQDRINELGLKKHTVLQKEYINEWKNFITILINWLVTHGFIPSHDESINHYIGSLP